MVLLAALGCGGQSHTSNPDGGLDGQLDAPAGGGRGGSVAGIGGGVGGDSGGLGGVGGNAGVGAAGGMGGNAGVPGTAGSGTAGIGPAGGGTAGSLGGPGGRAGAGGFAGAGGAGGPGGAAGAGTFTRTINQTLKPKLDLLFMVDTSQSMAPLQAKLGAQLGGFIDALKDPSGQGLPDLHVAVISSSFGGGAWGNVNQCGSGSHPGDDQGYFQQGPGGAGNGTCNMLHAGATFLETGDGVSGANFDGDVRDAFRCIALLGDTGCGFESQFESTYYALTYAAMSKAEHPQNGGFLRKDALLGIVMLTNEDDCSVSSQSLLLNPAVNSVTDPSGLGALWSYRCNEFGHLCDGVPPPHDAPPAGGITLNNCVSAEDMGKTDPFVFDTNGNPDPTQGHLWPTVKEFSEHVRTFKDNPDDILVAAIAGPVEPYRVVPQANAAAMGEIDPNIEHSCTVTTASGDIEYGDPAVRIHQWVDTFGANGTFYPICAATLQPALVGIADRLHTKLAASCVPGNIAWVNDADHGQGHQCQVKRASVSSSTGLVTTSLLPECDALVGNAPCYRLSPQASACASPGTPTLFQVCDEATCTMAAGPASGNVSLTLSCTLR